MNVVNLASRWLCIAGAAALFSSPFATARQISHNGQSTGNLFCRPEECSLNLKALAKELVDVRLSPGFFQPSTGFIPSGEALPTVNLVSNTDGISPIAILRNLMNYSRPGAGALYIELGDGTTGMVYGYQTSFYNPTKDRKPVPISQAIAKRRLGLTVTLLLNTSTQDAVPSKMAVVSKNLYFVFKLGGDGKVVSGSWSSQANNRVIQMGPTEAQPTS